MKKFQVSVTFCMQWNYAPKAASFAEELFTHFKGQIEKMELIPSTGGAFEINVNGELLYSKLDKGIFPDTDHIIQQMDQ